MQDVPRRAARSEPIFRCSMEGSELEHLSSRFTSLLAAMVALSPCVAGAQDDGGAAPQENVAATSEDAPLGEGAEEPGWTYPKSYSVRPLTMEQGMVRANGIFTVWDDGLDTVIGMTLGGSIPVTGFEVRGTFGSAKRADIRIPAADRSRNQSQLERGQPQLRRWLVGPRHFWRPGGPAAAPRANPQRVRCCHRRRDRRRENCGPPDIRRRRPR